MIRVTVFQVISSMEFQIAFWITLAVLACVVVYLVIVKKESNRYLTAYKPVKTERDKLKEENASLQKHLDAAKADVSSLKAEHKENKKNHKAASKAAAKADEKGTKEVSEIEQKLAEANADIKKLKQENFDLRRDNKELLKDKQQRGAGETENSKMVVDLRDARDKANEALGRANARIAELEKEKGEMRKSNGDASADEAKHATVTSASPDSSARIEELEREKKAVEQTLQEVRSELAVFKKGYRDKLDEAKKEVALDAKSFKDEIEQLKRQLQQSKTRADNNHRIFLIARAQLMLVEKRLALFDASYKPIVLGTSSTAIDETIKKFLTHDVRESRASADVIERDRKINDLVLEIKSLKKQLSDAQNAAKAVELSKAIKEDSKKTDSIESLVSSLTDDLNIKPSKDVFSDFSFDSLIASAKSEDKEKGGTSLKGLDFSGFGEDSWDAF